MGEHRIDEPVGALIDFALRQRRQLDCLRPARQQVGDVSQADQARRTCEQEPPGPWIDVYLVLDGEEQVRHSLDLVDDQEPVMAHEQPGIRPGRVAERRIVEIPQFRSRVLRHHEPGECALACLPRTIDHHYAGIRQRGRHRPPRMSREQCSGRIHS